MEQSNIKAVSRSMGGMFALIAGAVALALAWPRYDGWLLAWICLIPLMHAVSRKPLRRVFALAWLFATVSFAISFAWVTHSMVHYGGMPWMTAGLALLIMAGICGFFPAVAAWSVEWVRKRDVPYLPMMICWPVFWVATEYLRAHLPLGLGFPWNSLGQTQYSVLPMLQNADWGSFYGIGFIIVYANAVIVGAIQRVPRWKTHAIVAACIVTAAWMYGMWRLHQTVPSSKVFRAGIVQGNVDLAAKWNPENRHAILMNQIRLSETLIPRQPDLLLWSESSIPFIYRYAWRYRDPDNQPPGYHLATFMETYRVPLITGTLDRTDTALYNAAVLVSPGNPEAYYYKQKLVPFGEYIPAEHVFFFVNRMVDESIGTFDRGDSFEPLELPGGPDLSVTICYENIFPSINRRMVLAGGDIICNLTNDAWFGDTSGPRQHFSASCFRAVETRCPVLRCANTGISGAVDSAGRILHHTEFNREAAFIVEVSADNRKTLYLIAGDWFAIGCVLASFLICLTAFPGRSGRAHRRKTDVG